MKRIRTSRLSIHNSLSDSNFLGRADGEDAGREQRHVRAGQTLAQVAQGVFGEMF